MSWVNIKYACCSLLFARISITCTDTELGNTRAEILSSLFIHTHIQTLSVSPCVWYTYGSVYKYVYLYVCISNRKVCTNAGNLRHCCDWKGHSSCMNSENLLWGESLEASAHIAVQVWENNSGIFFFNRDEPEQQTMAPNHPKCSGAWNWVINWFLHKETVIHLLDGQSGGSSHNTG